MNEKKRLDLLLFELGHAPSREKAKAMVSDGIVYVNAIKVSKPSATFTNEDKIEILGEKLAYVSRGGLKLEKAIKSYNINLKDKICMDVGASTGGFTDCMLKNGARKVYSVDVGHDLLAQCLREDSRVVSLEGANARYLTKAQIKDDIEFVSVDVSFISLKKVIPTILEFLKNNAYLVCLIKPQFEAGRENIGKKGVVKNKKVHESVLKDLYAFFVESSLSVLGLNYSPIKGPEGNIEYLIFLQKSLENMKTCSINIEEIVKESHLKLNA